MRAALSAALLALAIALAPRTSPEAAQAQRRCPPWLHPTTQGSCR